jgi:hypothetical protein
MFLYLDKAVRLVFPSSTGAICAVRQSVRVVIHVAICGAVRVAIR